MEPMERMLMAHHQALALLAGVSAREAAKGVTEAVSSGRLSVSGLEPEVLAPPRDELFASLGQILPLAESRAEDLDETARAMETFAKDVSPRGAVREKVVEARTAAEKAAKAVQAAKVLLGLEQEEVSRGG